MMYHVYHVESHAIHEHSCDNLWKGTGNWVKRRGTTGAEREPTARLNSVTHILHNSPNSVYLSWPTAVLCVSVFLHVVAVSSWYS